MFSSRIEAGRLLAQELIRRHMRADVVLGIPRGGVVVAKEVAGGLHIPLDVLVVKKLGAPVNPELAIGALTYDDVTYIDSDLARSVGADRDFIRREVQSQHRALVEREKLLHPKSRRLEVSKQVVILADDGVATGATVRVAIEWLKKKGAQKIILAMPVVAKDTSSKLRSLVDECVILEEPESFGAVGQFYRDFNQVTDEEVVELIKSQIINPKSQ